ncbi:MAG: glycosyltransferase [Thermodesulfobacteriota bacterium]
MIDSHSHSSPIRSSDRYRSDRQAYWNKTAHETPEKWALGSYYHARLAAIYRYLVPPGQRVLELGCGKGDLLAALDPAFGVGVDFSGEMLQEARARHPELHFVCGDAHEVELAQEFDFVILSDLVNDLWDAQTVLSGLHRCTGPHTRIIVNAYSRLWEIPRRIAHRCGMLKPRPRQNWFTVEDISNLLYLTDFEVIRHWEEILWPFGTPVWATTCNKCLVKLWPFRLGALTNMIIARPRPRRRSLEGVKVSVVVPARNEAGNIRNIVDRVPEMGAGTEIVFVEGGSKDQTFETIQKVIEENSSRECTLFKQTGIGKGDAVRLGFEKATGEVLMILDADLTVPPEDLPRFLDAWASGRGEFINGVRLVYPMEDASMRFLNQIGNKFFSLAFTWLLGQSIKDTLCGTKVLHRDHYRVIAANRAYFGDFDPFGDFDLIFGAAKLNLKIVDLPIRYRARVYGETNISRWRHGLLLLEMVAFAMSRMKFI